MKLLKWLEVAGGVLLAGVLIVGNLVMNVIGLIIGAITSQKYPASKQIRTIAQTQGTLVRY